MTGSLAGAHNLQELQLGLIWLDFVLAIPLPPVCPGMIWGEIEDSLLARARAVIPQLELEMMRVEPLMPGWDSAPEETDWFSDSD